MAEKFGRWDENPSLRTLLIRHYNLEADISEDSYRARDLSMRKELLLGEERKAKENLEGFEKLEKEKEEYIRKAAPSCRIS